MRGWRKWQARQAGAASQLSAEPNLPGPSGLPELDSRQVGGAAARLRAGLAEPRPAGVRRGARDAWS